jgi:IclR family transcriptional regulator, pca regulon regulatory protein
VADSRYTIGSLAKGLKVLRLFGENVHSLRMNEISAASGLSMPTVFRIVATLEQEGYLERTAHGDIQPATMLLDLGFASLSGATIVQASEKPLHDLADDTGHRVHLGVLSGNRVLYLLRIGNEDMPVGDVTVGTTMPAVYTSMGKVLLAGLDAHQIDEQLGRDPFPPGGGPKAITTRAELDAQLERVRVEGFAIQDEELAHGLLSISLPIVGRDGRALGAINLAANTGSTDLATLRGPLLERFRVAADEISLRLGASGGASKAG